MPFASVRIAPEDERLDIITTALAFDVVPPEVGVECAPFEVDFEVDDPHAATTMIAAGTSSSLVLLRSLPDRLIRNDDAMLIFSPPPT